MNKQELREYNKLKARQYRADRKRLGLCVRCGSALLVKGVLCLRCRVYDEGVRKKRNGTEL